MIAKLDTTWRTLRRPISAEKRSLLDQRWGSLPAELKTDCQVLGRQLVHCSYLMGPSYCSFGCTHCYLPPNANRVPLPPLDEIKAKIEADRRLLGADAAIQITGGDVVDAYWRAGRPEALIAIVRHACDAGLVPMLMTHGQVLLEQPSYFARLVSEGGLRKIAIHIDVTQAGRPAYPAREIERESDLHPLREQFVDSILQVSRETGVRISAALTVTVTRRNLDGVREILEWLAADPRHLRAFNMVSFQTEAQVGRTATQAEPVTSTLVKRVIQETYGIEFGEQNIWVGDPECSRFTIVLIRPSTGRVVNLIPDDRTTRRFLKKTLDVFAGVGSRGEDTVRAAALRVGMLLRHPGWLLTALGYGLRRIATGRFPLSFLTGLFSGRARPLNIVMHNFMSTEMVEQGGETVERRLAACSFKGAVRRDDGWVAVPMCSMNALEREALYNAEIERGPAVGPTPSPTSG